MSALEPHVQSLRRTWLTALVLCALWIGVLLALLAVYHLIRAWLPPKTPHVGRGPAPEGAESQESLLADQEDAFARIRQLGGTWVSREQQVVEVDFSGRNLADEDLAILKAFPQLERLLLARTPVTDAGLSHLQGLAYLYMLDLQQTDVSDAGLKHITGLRRLKALKLKGTSVSDEGAREMQRQLPWMVIYR